MKARHKRAAIIVGGLAVVAIAATLVLNALNSNIALYVTPSEVAAGKTPHGQAFRIGGLVKEGSLYPALHKLEADGLIISEEVFIGKRARKYYTLTKPGKNAAKEAVDELLDFLKTIHTLVTTQPVSSYGLA